VPYWTFYQRKTTFVRFQVFDAMVRSQPEGSRKYFGALLVGYCGPEGLLFAGRVGTSFSERALETLYDGFQKIRRTMAMLA
jgi:ATP-dependent DNA ligase